MKRILGLLALAASLQIIPLAWAQVYDPSTGEQLVISTGGGGTPGTVNLTQVGSGNVPALGTGILGVTTAPTSTAAAGIAPVVSASLEGSHVLKASAGNLYDAYVTTGTTPGYLMTFNATSAPGDGAVTPIDCIQAPPSQTTALFTLASPPEVFSTGITIVFSTTGCFTKTISATVFFHGRIQ